MSSIGETPVNIACFVSSHGFGHAARTCAVLDHLSRQLPTLTLSLFTQTPPAFFSQSLTVPFTYHACETDVGLLQHSPLHCDVAGSVEPIREFLAFDADHLHSLVDHLKKEDTDLVLCDVSPLGLRVAAEAGIASLLLENFTWDWIYADYVDSAPAYRPLIAEMAAINRTASWRVTAEPACDTTVPNARVVGPLSRKPRRDSAAVRQSLGFSVDDKVVMVTQGGIAAETPGMAQLRRLSEIQFIVTGATASRRDGNIISMKNDANTYLPDYFNACDAVVGKVGYSTVAETWRAGLPMLYVTRDAFRESAPVAAFIEANLRGIGYSEADFARGNWVADIPDLVALPRQRPTAPDSGLEAVSDLIKEIMTTPKNNENPT